MSLNQRISPSLSEKAPNLQAPVCKQEGFTLVELMAVVAILGVLLGIASGAWQSIRGDAQVRSAAASIRSALTAARTQAFVTGENQYVGIDFANDRLTSTLVTNGVYVVGTGWDNSATVWQDLEGVDVIDSKTGGDAPASPVTTVKSFEFKPSSGASVIPGAAYSVRVEAANNDLATILVVTRATGRTHVKECTVAQANANGC